MNDEYSDMNQTSGLNMPQTSGKIRRLFQHSAIYSLSTSVQRLQGLLLMPIYTSAAYLPQVSQYSNYGLVYTFIAFMNFVYLYGMDSAFLRYFFLGKSGRKTVYSSTFFILAASGVVTSLLLLVFARPIAELILFSGGLAFYIRLAALILFFDTIGNLPFLILRAEERPVSYSVFRIARFVLELLLNILFVVALKKGVPGILYANVIASVVNLLLMSPIAFKYLQLSVNVSLLKEMLLFGLPFLPNGIAFMTIEMMDRFLVTGFLGKDILSFYHANYKFASVMLLLIVGFRNAWQPFFLKIANQPDAKVTYSRIFRYYLLLGINLLVFITFFVRNLLTYHYFDSFYILGVRYWEGIGVIPWIVLAYFFYGVYVIFTPAFYIKKKSQYMVLFTGAGAVINLVVNLLLLPRIGFWGAAVATVAAYAAMAVLIFGVSQKIYPIPLNYRALFGVVLFVGLAYLIYYVFGLNLVWRIVGFIFILIASLLVFLNQRERGIFWRYLPFNKK